MNDIGVKECEICYNVDYINWKIDDSQAKTSETELGSSGRKKLLGDEQCFKLAIAIAETYNQFVRFNVSLRTYWLMFVRSKMYKNTVVYRNHVCLRKTYVLVFCRMIILRDIIIYSGTRLYSGIIHHSLFVPKRYIIEVGENLIWNTIYEFLRLQSIQATWRFQY